MPARAAVMEGGSRKKPPASGSSGEHDLRGIVRTAASHRELVSMLLLQGREDQIEQYTDMSTNERIIQESMSRHMPQTTVMGKSGTTVRDDEAIWETARLRTKVSSLESEKAVLQENMRKTMNHVADLKSQVACTEQLSRSEHARVHAVASQHVAQLEQQVGRQQNTLNEMATAAEALASDNYEMSTQLLGIQDEKVSCNQNAQALKERVATLQELFMRNMDEAGKFDNPTVHAEIQQRCLDELATEEVLDISRPPTDFPIPEAPAIAKIRPALQEIGALRQERDRLQSQVKTLSEKFQNTRMENQGLQRQAVRDRNTAKEKASLHQSRMVGMLRRLQYLVQEMKNKEEGSKEKDAYIHRLEAQLVAEHRRRLPRGISQKDKQRREMKCKKNSTFKHQAMQERSWMRGMSSTPWLKNSETDSSGVGPHPNSKVANAQSPLQTASFRYPCTELEKSPLYSSHSSSALQKDTVASIEEMERQLRILDEEVRAGNHGLGPWVQSEAYATENPDLAPAFKNQEGTYKGSIVSPHSSQKDEAEQGFFHNNSDIVTHSISQDVTIGSEKSSKTGDTTPGIWVNPYFNVPRVNFNRSTSSLSQQNTGSGNEHRSDDLRMHTASVSTSESKETMKNAFMGAMEAGFGLNPGGTHRIPVPHLGDQCSFNSTDNDLISTEVVKDGHGKLASTQVLGQGYLHWSKVSETEDKGFPSTSKMMMEKASVQTFGSDTQSAQDVYPKLKQSMFLKSAPFNHASETKSQWRAELVRGVLGRMGEAPEFEGLLDDSEARRAQPPQPIQRRKRH